ncbi:SRPBCC family protein [Luteimonas suaedae]|uniref:SRPBCC family protein n=1 Tax=Luteimonas suaedae TaxID=2605430 RepID=UPI0011EF8D55|nr:SRPBCC domain-containing protein [Luteimonas suaedae]
MPIKKDESGKRWVEMELLVPGTPEQVWQAMATGAGNSAWFTRTEIEERVGGTLHFDLGAMGSSTGEVTAWEPPLRFGYVERDWSDGAPPVATEITITARSGDRCVMRMVHSLFASTDDWDDQLEGFEGGWPGFFEVLRIYLAHFAGREAGMFGAMERVEASESQVWRRLTELFGTAGANSGDEITAPETPERLSGVVERIDQSARHRYQVLRLNAPEPGVALIGTYRWGESTHASVSLYLYGDDAKRKAAASEPKWRAWLERAIKA